MDRGACGVRAVKLFDFIPPRHLGTAGLAIGIIGVAADHLPPLGSEDHRYTLGGIAVAGIGLLLRILADQHRGFSSLRSYDARQDQDLEACKADILELRPKGAVARLLRSRVIEEGRKRK